MKNKLKKYIIRSHIVLLLVIFFTYSVSAHDMNIDIVGRSVTVKATYSDGKPVSTAEIIVYYSDGTIYQSGTTDEKGEYQFEVKETSTTEEFIVEVQQTGHKSLITIDFHSIKKEDEDFFVGFKIIAGVGYLVGIAGVISYYNSWKMKKK
jgi:nickel transport protein